MKRFSWFGIGIAALLAGCGGGSDGGDNGNNAPALDLIGVTTDGRIVSFDPQEPNDLHSEAPITGLGGSERIVGIDQRPQTSAIYGVSNIGRVYTLNVATGAATAVGADGVVVDANASAFEIDFYPQVDQIRLGNSTSQNIRINPITGAQVDGDADGSNGVQGDTNFAYEGGVPAAEMVGLAYTNSTANATATVLYGIDRAQDQLVALNSTTSSPAGPNGGRLVPVGSLGLSVTDYAPFDITPDNAYAVAAVGEGERSRIALIDLSTGRANVVARTPVGTKLVGLAVRTFAAIP